MPDVPAARLAAELLAVLMTAKLSGALAARLRQPPVLGELLAGAALGAAGALTLGSPLLRGAAEAGVLLLLFETGLDCDWDRLFHAGPASARVAAAGVAAPFLMGWALMRAWGYDARPALYGAAALTATSVGVTARVLRDVGRLHSPEGAVILGAAVLDDVLGLALLAALGAGRGAGSVLIVLAFAAGLVWARSGGRESRGARRASQLLAPVFFVATGAQVRFGAFDRRLVVFTILLIVAAAIGKTASGLAVARPGVRRWAVGVGMIPRGEVGLVFAQVGLAAGAIDAPLYGAVVAMVAVTTLLAPPLLKRALR